MLKILVNSDGKHVKITIILIYKLFLPILVAQTMCSDGIYPVSGVCNEFYQCSNGQETATQVCPAGLFFNPDNGVCDYPENVDCDRKLFSPNLNEKK